MTVKIMHTNEVKELLEKVAGYDQEGGNQRTKDIVHRLMSDVFQLIEDFDVTPEEFWPRLTTSASLARMVKRRCWRRGWGSTTTWIYAWTRPMRKQGCRGAPRVPSKARYMSQARR